MIGGIVLAAGESKRFGGIKQLAELDGRPLLEHAIRPLIDAELDSVIAVLGANALPILRAVDFQGAEHVICECWHLGVGASLGCGISHLHGQEAAVVVLGDQPCLSSAVIRHLLAHRGDAIVLRATYGGQPSHPVLLERELFPKLMNLEGEGARQLFETIHVRDIACDGLASEVDIDTPEDLLALALQLQSERPEDSRA